VTGCGQLFVYNQERFITQDLLMVRQIARLQRSMGDKMAREPTPETLQEIATADQTDVDIPFTKAFDGRPF
jgi:hypothetical protein